MFIPHFKARRGVQGLTSKPKVGLPQLSHVCVAEDSVCHTRLVGVCVCVCSCFPQPVCVCIHGCQADVHLSDVSAIKRLRTSDVPRKHGWWEADERFGSEIERLENEKD